MTTVTFSDLGVSDAVLAVLNKIGFHTPTPIQEQAIPLALEGRDILGSAQTGTGKTAAFGIPLVEMLLATKGQGAVVLAPTRELAAQVLKTLQPLLAPHKNIHTALLIGGESMGKQYAQLKRSPRLIVGTPGRINDHLERGSVKLSNTGFLVLDEMDRMLDMGFSVQIDRIVKHMSSERQTLLFSATVPDSILKVAQKYQTEPQRIAVGSTTKPMEKIKQELVKIPEDSAKYGALIEQLNTRTGSVIVFVRTKHGAKRMAEKLDRDVCKADAIHGNLNQNRRDRVIQAFRNKQFRVMVATDVAARGLDIPHIEHVINYDLPECPEDYIHRIGRTARGSAEGEAVSFVTPTDSRKWHAIQLLIDPEAAKAARPARSNDDEQRRGGNRRPHRHRRGGGKFRGGNAEGGRPQGANRNNKKRHARAG